MRACRPCSMTLTKADPRGYEVAPSVAPSIGFVPALPASEGTLFQRPDMRERRSPTMLGRRLAVIDTAICRSAVEEPFPVPESILTVWKALTLAGLPEA